MIRDPFRRFLAATVVSQYGDWLSTVAVVVVLLRLTGSPAAPAGYMLCRVLPRMLGTLPGGALTDRLGGVRVLAVASLAQAALIGAIVAGEHQGAVWAVFAAVAVGQAITGVTRTALGAVVPSLVGRGDAVSLVRANSLLSMTISSALFAGPALGSVLILAGGPDLALWLDAASFVAGAALLTTIPSRHVGSAAPLRGVGSGFGVVVADPLLLAGVTAYAASAIVVTATSAVLVVAAADRFGGDSHVGFLYAAVGAGDIVAGVLLLGRRTAVQARTAILGGCLAGTVVLATFSLTHSLWQALLVLAVAGAFETGFQVWASAEMQQRVGGEVLGRVSAVRSLAEAGGAAVGALIALTLVARVHWYGALFVSACVAAGLLIAGDLASSLRPAAASRSDPA